MSKTAYSKGVAGLIDEARKPLLERIAELEALLEETADDGATVGWMIAEDRLRKRNAELEANNESLEKQYSLAQEEIVRLKDDINVLAPAWTKEWTKEEDWSDE